MLNTEHLITVYRYQSKADLQFDKVIENVDDDLKTKEDINLKLPFHTVEKGHDAFCDYVSIRPEDEDRDYDEEDDDSYIFHEIYVGLTITTKQFHGFGDIKPFFDLYCSP